MSRIFLLALGLVVHSTSSALIPITVVQLSKADLSSVEQIACLRAHSPGLETTSAYVIDLDKTLHANIACKPHGKEGHRSLRLASICEKKSSWKCSTAVLEIMANVEGKLSPVRGSEIPLRDAADIVEALGSAGWFQRHSLKELTQGGCSVQPGIASDLVSLWCGGGYNILLARNCKNEHCDQRIISITQAIP